MLLSLLIPISSVLFRFFKQIYLHYSLHHWKFLKDATSELVVPLLYFVSQFYFSTHENITDKNIFEIKPVFHSPVLFHSLLIWTISLTFTDESLPLANLCLSRRANRYSNVHFFHSMLSQASMS